METLHQDWGRRLRAAREKSGLSQTRLSWDLRVAQGLISRWEKGLSSPRDDMRIRLAEFFGVRVRELFPYPDDTEAA